MAMNTTMATPKPLTLAPIATPAPSRLARLALARLALAPKPRAYIFGLLTTNAKDNGK